MSGPVTTSDVPPIEGRTEGRPACVELHDSRPSQVGALPVRRALPRRARRTVGAWCYADHMGPVAVTEDHGLDLGPHPHIGLQTVTWLLAGEVLHRDSLGTEQLIRPGELNLMTAGHGVAHSEEATGRYRGDLHGIQLWVAQPDATRHGPAAFEHHASLPAVDLACGAATVVVGELDGTRSPARRDTDHLGVDLELRVGRTSLPLRPDHEHGLIVLEGAVTAHSTRVASGQLAYLGTGREELVLDVDDEARVFLLGGAPFEEPLLMWWNFVARTTAEIDDACEGWPGDDDRFGVVASPLALIPAPVPSWRGGQR